MISNPHLDAMIAKETYQEMLAALTPKQLAVVALRLDGLSFDATGELLGLSRGSVHQRMLGPRHRLPETFPHLQKRFGGDS